MKTETFERIDLQTEYRRTLLAARISASVFIWLAVTWGWLQHESIGPSAEIFENRVQGGFKAMPALTKLVVNHSDSIAAAVSLGVTGALAGVWFFGRRVSQVIYAGTAGVVICLLAGSVISYALQQPLIKIITKFNG